MSGVLFKQFLASRQVMGCPPSSLTWMKDAHNRFKRFQGGRPLDDRLCRQYLSSLQTSGLPAAEVRREWRGLRIFLRWAVEQGELDKRVLLPGPPVRTTYRDALSAHDVERIIIAAPDPDQRGAVLLWAFWTTGLRSEKLRALRWDDVDFDLRVLRVASITGQRVAVPLPSSLADPLRDWKGKSKSAWVFSAGNSPLSALEVWQLVRGAGQKAGFPFLSPGQFQYSWLREYLRNGGPRLSPDIQARLAQPFHVRGFYIPNLFTLDELREAHARHSPMEAALRSLPPSLSSPRRKP